MQREKVLFRQDNAPCHKSKKRMVKLNELRFELLSHPPYSSDLAPRSHWLFTDLQGMIQGKKFGSNEEVIAEVKAYFESKKKSFHEKGLWETELATLNHGQVTRTAPGSPPSPNFHTTPKGGRLSLDIFLHALAPYMAGLQRYRSRS
ncbi:histone-lysine N-methyltransferase SETMAR [Trichonephila clavipes]|nr:histone-lysine N-methyltransferase SETMAR [Trichonephila clavipes]